MRIRMKLASTLIALVLTIGLLVVGVFAASKASVGLKGTVSFVADDVYCTVSGEISGVKEKVNLPTLNFSSTREDIGWESQDLTFLDKNSTIKIEIIITNLSQERSVYVDIVGDVGIKDNIDKQLKQNGNAYKSGQQIEIPKNESKKFLIEMSIDDTNYSVKQVEFDYTLNLNNFETSSSSVSESYNVTCEFSSDSGMEYTQLTKSEESPISGTNVYQITDGMEIVAYIDFNKDISIKIEGKTKLTATLYISFVSEAVIKVNGKTLEIETEYGDDYNYYNFEISVESDTNIQIIGDFYGF